jgi:hypothetical protein
MITSTRAAQVRGNNPCFRIWAVVFALSCIAARTEAADFTVGGSISNLVGNGLVLSLDTQLACIASGNISSVTNSPAAGGTSQCQITATEQCCSLSSSNFMSTTNPDGTINCTVVCGIIVGRPGGTSPAAPTATQTVSPAANATSYTFGTAVPDGSAYTVSVVTQPSGPAQVCSVANATGTVSGANVTNADVTCTTVTHTVTATAGPNGSVSPLSQTVNDGSTAIVTLMPSPGFTASASGCGGSLGGDGVTYTTGAITADCTVAATFAPIPLLPTTTTLSLSPNPALTNQTVAASVTVTNGTAAVPTGTVAIAGGGQSCNAPLVNGSGNCTLVYAAPGTYSITATYPGDAQNLSSAATASLVIAAPAPAEPAPTLDGIALVVLALVMVAFALLALACNGGRYAEARRTDQKAKGCAA